MMQMASCPEMQGTSSWLATCTRRRTASMQGHTEELVELCSPTAGNTCVDAALTCQEAARTAGGVLRRNVDAVVPRAGVDIDPEALRHTEGPHVLWFDVITLCVGAEANDKWHRLARPEELSAVGVVIAHPQVDGVATRRARLGSMLGERPQAVQVGVVLRGDGEVPAAEEVAAPLDLEVTFRGASLVSGARIQLPPAPVGPWHYLEAAALYGEVLGVADQVTQPTKGLVRGQLQRHLAHRQARRQLRGPEVLGGEDEGFKDDDEASAALATWLKARP
eukprot:CAMPEP_0197914498 /NCGR_PEP_ID=MMETSP1439-20131203/78610_1 /TAXON_ID=66791 /ORGANISM="Gonyaulax spinifera, Strain CCMP409" /LENGTH=277 /DNA_ID=CAMNT_0043536409 /DNA_START=135 /DNA_END=965 /DNA_ORIENTATION=+